jgi:flavin reductase (DIM6/NTAB) family NADH-FMN oxidoreductase RutF
MSDITLRAEVLTTTPHLPAPPTAATSAGRSPRVEHPTTLDFFRDAMSRVAAPVTVVTTMVGSTPFGTTVSSFSSLSMHPPLVMFALDRRSQLLAALRANRHLGVNVLEHRQHEVAAAFSRRQADRFSDSGWYASAGLPRLPGITAWLECRGDRFIEAGDHEIVVASVINVETFAGLPLMYAQRTFGTHSALLEAAFPCAKQPTTIHRRGSPSEADR